MSTKAPKSKAAAKAKAPKVTNKKEVAEEVVRKKKVKATPEDHLAHYNELLALLDAEIDRKKRSKEAGVRTIQKIHKLALTMRKEVGDVTKSKAVRSTFSTRKKTNSGITMQYYVSKELAKFLKIDADIQTVSRKDVMQALSVYIKLKPDEKRPDTLKWKHLNPGGKRDLQNPNDKQLIIPDKTLLSLIKFKPGQSKDKLRFIGIQGLISHHFLEAVKEEAAEEEEAEVEEEVEGEEEGNEDGEEEEGNEEAEEDE